MRAQVNSVNMRKYNVTCSVWTACSFTVPLSQQHAQPKLDKLTYLRRLRGKKESVVYFCFCVQTESKTTAASGSGGSSWKSPSCSRALASGRSRAASRKSVGRVRAPQEKPVAKRSHSAVISRHHESRHKPLPMLYLFIYLAREFTYMST